MGTYLLYDKGAKIGSRGTVAPVLAAERDAKVTFVHAINGVKIKMAKELPAGTYKFVVVNHATDKMIVTKTVVIKGGSTVRVRARLNAKNVPALNVKTK